MNPSSTSTADNRLANANAAAAAAASNRPFTSPPQPPRTTIPQQPRHSYPSPQQQQQKQKQSLFTAQSHTTRHPNLNPSLNPSLHPQFHRPHDSSSQPQQQQQQPPPHQQHHQGILYPVASSGRGFIHRPLRPQQQQPDQTVTVANPGAYPPRPVITFPNQVARPFGFSSSESLNQPVHMIRPPFVQHPNFGVATTGAVLAPIRGIPVSSTAHPKVASSPSIISDCNGYKDSRERNREDVVIIRDRKVRITDGASLYALCRSWLRNGNHEESQPLNGDGAKCLPRPLPIPVAGSHLPTKREFEEDEENVGSVQHLSAEELLQRHIQRAKRVRARLREERLQRIARYKARLATLLPPPVEQFADDTAA